MTGHAQSRSALRHLPSLNPRLRLVRSNAAAATTPHRFLLQHALPGAVDHPCRQERTRHG
ncbi:MAG: hypothetical protein EBY30_10095 [Rhodospirillales bacterium]|jgi:hypothetical protein|nr:hypothetical protein [Rhodospirillales bacterium]